MGSKLSIDAAVLKAIADTLPETQVTMIKEALIERDELREQLKTSEATQKDYSKYWSDEREKNQKLVVDIDRELKENYELRTRAEKAEAELADAKVEKANAQLDAVERTVDKFLKNTIYRETLQHQVVDEFPQTTMQYGPNGQSTMVATGMVTKTNKPVTDIKESGKE